MILHKANLTDFTKKTVRTSKFSRVIDTKSVWHFYALIMNSEKGILKKIFIYNFIKKNKIPRSKFNPGSERSVH